MIPEGNPITQSRESACLCEPEAFDLRSQDAQVNEQKHPRRVLLRRRLRPDRTLTTSALLCTSNENRKGNQERNRERKKERDRDRERERERDRPAHSSAVALTSLSLSLSFFLALSLSLSLSFPYLSLSLSLSLSRLSVKPMSLSLSLSLFLSRSPPLLAPRTRLVPVCPAPKCDRRKGRAEREPILSLIHISEPTRLGMISYAVFC